MWHDPRTLTLAANLLCVAALLALAATGVTWLAQRPAFALTQIELRAVSDLHPDAASTPPPLRYVSPASVRTAIAGALHGNFFTVDLTAARRAFETVPWVRRAAVRRVWPNALQVTLEEQQPMAYWNDAQLLNVWGEAFTANLGELEDGPALPLLLGPDGSEALVARRYGQLARALAPLGIGVERLELTARYAWQATLANGMTLELGRDPQAEHAQAETTQAETAQAEDSTAAHDTPNTPDATNFSARIERFVAAWPEVQRALDGREITHADLRYPNGFAVTLVELPKTPPAARRR